MGDMSAMPLERDSDVGRLAAEVERSHERVTLTRDGEPVAVVISAAELAGLEDTLEMLRNPDEAAAVDEGIADAERDSTTRTTFSPISVAAVTTPERYRVRFASRARRDLDGLPLPVATAMIEHLLGPVARSPLRLGGPLRGRWEGYLSARRGGYRAIYRVDDKRRELLVVHIGPRADVYGGG